MIEVIARAGGGGSGGGDGGGGGILVLPLLIIGVVASWLIRKKRIKKAKANQHLAQAGDASWSNDVIEHRVRDVFYAFQRDWGAFDTERMKTYLTPRYRNHIIVMLAALKQMHRRNVMQELDLKSITLFGVHDNPNDELDRFDVEIKASGTDYLLHDATASVLKASPTTFEEIWHFEREGSAWMLDGITQVNRDGLIVKYEPVIDRKYLDFAEANGFFYNADFGWLLLPLHGVLFSEASYGNSDINHHVIGLHRGVIVQFFEYVPLSGNKSTIKDHLRHLYKRRSKLTKYTIAHATLPKYYSNILVERRNIPAFFSFHPQGMTQITLEWPQFNKLFEVYATDIDKVTSLELLHPAFMERLAHVPFRLNLEIVGNNLYLYTTDKKADYQQMLVILQEAFEEMRM